MNPYLLLAAAEGGGPAVIPDVLDPHIDVNRVIASPPEGWPPAVRRRLADRRALASTVRRWLDSCAAQRIEILTPADAHYPESLREAPLRPLALFARGNLEQVEIGTHGIAVVGSRTPTAYGHAAARDFSDALASSGIPLWSGLAAGVDACAHRACLAVGMPTVAVVAGGLDHVYPAAHRGLVEEIVETGGACISELPPGRKPRRGHFPRRNRILALATGGVIVIEAGLASGSLHTARFAADAGTPVWAVPGPYTSPRSRGCHRLLADGAMIASDPESLLRDLGVARSRSAEATAESGTQLALSADARAIVETLSIGPRPTDMVRRESRLEHARFLAALFELIERGRVTELAGGLLAVRAVGD